MFGQTAAQDGVKLWDLRKLRNFRTFALYDEDTATQSGTRLTAFSLLKNVFTAFYWSMTQKTCKKTCANQKGVTEHFSKIYCIVRTKQFQGQVSCVEVNYNISEYAIFGSHVHIWVISLCADLNPYKLSDAA